MIVGAFGVSVKQTVQDFLDGKLKTTDSATVGSHYGMGGGMGRGQGGGGRGAGRGGGIG